MEKIDNLLQTRLDRVTRPEPTIVIHKGEEFYITDTGAQEKSSNIFVKFSVKFRELQLAQLKGPPLSVFICLALHIAENGSCFPSVSLICQETGFNRDTVFKALRKLEFMGYIAKEEGDQIDPVKGTRVTKEMILGLNAKRIGDILAGAGDKSGAAGAYQEARDYYATALKGFGENTPEAARIKEDLAAVPEGK